MIVVGAEGRHSSPLSVPGHPGEGTLEPPFRVLFEPKATVMKEESRDRQQP